MKKRIIKVCVFLVILDIVLTRFVQVFQFKYGDGIYGLKVFYELPENTVDVLVLGSSHAFEDINPAVLYEEYGITAYDLCGSIQPMWNTYYYLKEALKTQTPALVVLEAYCVNMNVEYIDDSRIIKNIYGMKWSKDKLNALKDSVPEERRKEFLVEPLQYHGRYIELTKEDFLPYQANENRYKYWKGFGNNMTVEPQSRNDVSGVKTEMVLHAKVEEYYRKIIELVRERNIPMLIVVSPYSGISEQEQGKYIKAAEIAKEYDIPFINYNLLYDETGLDFNSDFADSAHLNYLGNRKYTQHLGQYLMQNYKLPDRRGDERYYSWEMDLKYYKESMREKELQQYSDMKDYFEHIPEENCVTIFTVTNASMWRQIKCEPYNDLSCMSLIRNNGQIVCCLNEDGVWHSNIGGTDFAVSSSRVSDTTGNEKFQHTVNVGLSEYQKVSDGINVIVYNTYTGRMSDAVGFDAANGFTLVR